MESVYLFVAILIGGITFALMKQGEISVPLCCVGSLAAAAVSYLVFSYILLPILVFVGFVVIAR